MSFLSLNKDGVVSQYEYSGHIQLLTKDPQPYIQAFKGSVSSNYKAYLVDYSGNKYDVTDHIKIRNGDNGIMAIKIIYLPYDFGLMPVRLKIDRFGGGIADGIPYYYTDYFLLTRQNEKYTSRIDYVEKDVSIPSFGLGMQDAITYQSIRLQFYKNNLVDSTDVETYYQITRSQTINQRISIKLYVQWKTLPISEVVLSKLAKALYDGRCYINQVRNYIVEGLTREEREGMSNISENMFLTDPDEKDTIHIIPEIIDPEWITAPFLASSDRLASSDYLISQETVQWQP